MLRKKERLTTEQFDQFFATGKRIHTTHLQLIHAAHNEFHGAAVVGKKVFKNAVNRNKLRRQMYNILYRQKISQKLHGVYMFVAKPKAKDIPFQELKEEMTDVIARVEKQSNNL